MSTLNKDTVKNSLITKHKELQEKFVQLTLEKRILEAQITSKFPETRRTAAEKLIQKSQEVESHEITMNEVEKMINE